MEISWQSPRWGAFCSYIIVKFFSEDGQQKLWTLVLSWKCIYGQTNLHQVSHISGFSGHQPAAEVQRNFIEKLNPTNDACEG